MLISVHMPKTAGTSFEQILLDQFGSTFRSDYGDRPLHQSRFQRAWIAWRGAAKHEMQSARCIHGHFLPYKYRGLSAADARFVTWFRDPVDRLRSHYDFWQREYDPATAGLVHQRMMTEQWNFERFALGPELRNIYALFLWRFPLERFDFIGIFENLHEDMVRFAQGYLGGEIDLKHARASAEARTPLDDSLIERIIEWHAIDMRLYQRAIALAKSQAMSSVA